MTRTASIATLVAGSLLALEQSVHAYLGSR